MGTLEAGAVPLRHRVYFVRTSLNRKIQLLACSFKRVHSHLETAKQVFLVDRALSRHGWDTSGLGLSLTLGSNDVEINYSMQFMLGAVCT